MPEDPSFAQSRPPVAAYDVAPDAERFLINCLVEETLASPVTVMINWSGALTRQTSK